MIEGLVSIITPSYNSEKFIAQTIESVLNQSYNNWELLITDDGSSDNSLKIIEKFTLSDSRIKVFKIPNSGPANARNNSIKNASGQFLAFLDSDDLWFKDFLKISIKEVKKTEGFVFSSYKRCNEITLEEEYPDFIVPSRVTYTDILKTNSISCLTAFIDTKKIGKEYMPNVMYRQDMGLWLTYLKKIKYAYGIKKTLAIYRIRANSHSRNKKKLIKHQWYFYRKVEKLSFFKTIYIMLLWSYNGFKKY
ncbi:glycosyltransferase family 2 protein [Polaribacter batillariae]|uniref:Glycosyltransferase family 2 protein n=1 Tax=Polaribacter batillariae TaxID=2808900 RepID=A0ABX7STK4_9FLAO|nr:glycosyltransferase family 2 protein [Polaribacter batillariae]QTD37577.1 glycosyltransferase family 2 protein [Polaribacter batillariae]